MPNHTKSLDTTPLNILTELAVEGASSIVEAQRALLVLAQQQNEIILNGVKERIGGFPPAVAMTDLLRRSLDTLIGMQQELLTATSKQTLHWVESAEGEPADRTAHLVEFAREGVETFTRAQNKFLEAVAQETANVSNGKPEHEGRAVKKTELAHLAREAGNAFIEAQKRLLDVMGQQMNVNLDAAARTAELVSSSRIVPMTSDKVKNFFDTETSLLGSFMKSAKPKVDVRAKKRGKARTSHREKAVHV